MSGPARCSWLDLDDAAYVRYHDEEWGVPEHDDRKLYEMFLLELFQAGLSWRLLLHKRENFRRAYDGFSPEKVAAYGGEDVERLMGDAGCIRSRAKIEAAIGNAQVFLDLQKEWGSFDAYLWHFTCGRVVREPAGAVRDALSDVVSADLRRRGTRFAGSVTVFSLLQAVGVINSHDEGCFRCAALSEGNIAPEELGL